MASQLDRIIDIIQHTGDKVIVLKDNAEFVITSLDKYSQLVQGDSPLSQLSESQMLDKINRDIALWRESQKELSSPDKEVDFQDLPQTPRYDTSDLHHQDTVDKLADDIFVENQDLPEEPDANWDFDQPLANTQVDLEPSDDFDLAEDFDLSQDSKEPVKKEPVKLEDILDTQQEQDISLANELDSQESNLNVNNFGYVNPKDTNSNNSNNQESEDSWLTLDENNPEFDDFDDIPPPPDIKKS